MNGRFRMPGWVSDNAASVAREAAPYRGMLVANQVPYALGGALAYSQV